MANLIRKMCTKLYQKWARFVKDMTKTFWHVFFSSQCSSAANHIRFGYWRVSLIGTQQQNVHNNAPINGCHCCCFTLSTWHCAEGCSDIIVSRLMPLLTITGEDGHVEHYTVDLTRRVVRHCTYVTKHLIREFVVPLDVESPGWSLSGKFIKVNKWSSS